MNHAARFVKKAIITVFLFLYFGESYSFPAIAQKVPEEYGPQNILGFARYLISKNEFFRAQAEFKRLKSYYPNYLKKEIFFVSELYLLYQSGQYQDILSKDKSSENPNTNAILDIFKTDTMIQKNEFVKASSLLNSINFSGINKDIDIFIYKRMILSYILMNNFTEAGKIVQDQNIAFNEPAFDKNTFNGLISYGESCYDSRKNPYMAMALGIIPGIGYVYSGERATGVIAFILIGALSAATYYSFKTNNKPVGIFIGAATTFFYGGSIIGGYLGARKYNEALMNEMSSNLSQKARLSEDREYIFGKYGAGAGDGQK